ncbi:MAG: hypothetical protein QM775_29610 [Pirellulales bacterium]
MTEATHWPAVWTAERLGTGKTFFCFVRPPSPPSAETLEHWQLTADEFAAKAVSLDEARRRWQAFVRPGDCLTVYNEAVARLARRLGEDPRHCLVLKSVDLGRLSRHGNLDEQVASVGLTIDTSLASTGRAGKRLANLTVLVRYLHSFASAIE